MNRPFSFRGSCSKKVQNEVLDHGAFYAIVKGVNCQYYFMGFPLLDFNSFELFDKIESERESMLKRR